MFDSDPLDWKGEWQKHWQDAAASCLAKQSSRRRPEGPNISKLESAALRKVGRKGGAHMLPSSLLSKDTYAVPLEERDLPPSMRRKRKLETAAIAHTVA